jgi:hypothetical protein
MATGAAIAAGAKAVGGIAGGIKAGKKSEDLMGAAIGSYEEGINIMKDYYGQALGYGEDTLAFSQQMLANWEETFGGIEQNLSDYYANLDPEKYAQQYKSDLYSNIDKQTQQLNEGLASSGLLTSGMQAQTEKEAAFAKAAGGAQADLAAEDKVRGMQQGFLNTGASQKSAANSSILNSYGNLSNLSMSAGSNLGSAYQNMGNLQANMGNLYGQSSGGFMKAGLDGVGQFSQAGSNLGWW